MVTLYPRLLSNRPSDAAVMPLPREDTTPPVTKMCLVIRLYLRFPAWNLPSLRVFIVALEGAAGGRCEPFLFLATFGAPARALHLRHVCYCRDSCRPYLYGLSVLLVCRTRRVGVDFVKNSSPFGEKNGLLAYQRAKWAIPKLNLRTRRRAQRALK